MIKLPNLNVEPIGISDNLPPVYHETSFSQFYLPTLEDRPQNPILETIQQFQKVPGAAARVERIKERIRAQELERAHFKQEEDERSPIAVEDALLEAAM